MLLIWDVTSAANAKGYYAACLAPGTVPDRQGYYSEGQESPGLYSGKLAQRLGLAGKPVDKATFDRLCDNRHPTENRSLTPRTNAFRRVCKDFTFSGPKSFSILEAFASEAERRRLRQAFDDAAMETFAQDIEPDMQTRVRKDGADCDRPTGNALAAGFDHATARPEHDDALPDPHWHKHLLVWNATHDPIEDRVKAGQVGDIVRDKGYYRAAFYSRLAARLEAMGYGIDRRGGYEWEIAGVPQSAIDTFSKRTAQIDGEAERRGITDAARKGGLGAKLRGRKPGELTLPELRRHWYAQLTDGERDALARLYRKEIARGRDVSPAEAVRFALDHASETLSVIPERELQRLALLHGLGGVTGGQVAAELPRQGVFSEVVDGRSLATTAALQREEDFLAGVVASGRGEVTPVGLADGLDRQLAGGKRLNDGQWQAVVGLLTSPNRVNLVEGPAGAGKSSLLAKLDEGMRRAGQRVTYLATTTAAAGVLQKDGFEARTVAHFLLDEKLQKQAAGGRVVIDESSMLGHRDAGRLYELARRLDLKLIHLGDPMQHGSVPRGAFLHVLKAYGHVRPFRLTTILRQESPEYRAAAALLSEGKAAEGFDAVDALGWVKELTDDGERYRQMAAEFVASWDELKALPENERVLCVSPTHREAAAITAEIRAQLRAAGRLGPQDVEVTRLVPVEASEAQRRLATTYRPGDVVVFHQNCKGGFTKGDRLTIDDPAAVPLHHADKFSLYRPERLALAVGDRIRITGTVRTLDGQHTLKNGVVQTVAGFTSRGIRLGNGWVIGKEAGHLRHGFVETSFGSQGRTVRRVILGMAASSLPATNQEQMYVSSSRARERMTLYTDDKDAVRRAIPRSSAKRAALDLKSPLDTERMRRQRDRRRRLAFHNRLHAAGQSRAPMLAHPPPTHAGRLRHQERNAHAR